ncbi:hypothetical protein [Desulfonema magnum]|uniref:Uncharacterized protein n=1 Tax=Desulfonema magnum TaxID=45655 RepID=A0A975GLW5_9BACT|nr:hypothetical protein [Desulfonema magnum]QTA86010.1 Uncharacterized protein dnm_020280 [Desulfonema magnum]
MEKLFITILSLLLISSSGKADTIFLKNGRKIEAERVWKEDNQIKCDVYGAIVGYPKENVDRIELSETNWHNNDFKFDIWTFGMSVEKVIEVAERNDVPLEKPGVFSGNKHFRRSVKKFAKTATKFRYRDCLLGKRATIYLSFTPTSKKLFAISIRWLGLTGVKKSDFKNEIESVIIKKYGKQKKKEKEIFYDTICWLTEDKNEISVKIGNASIQLNYIEKTIEKMGQKEMKDIQERKKKNYRMKDGDKF